MAIFKCKMCGGSLEVQENADIVVCEFCDTKQTLPKLDSDRKVNLYDRANHFRRNGDYDKAMGIYEQVLNEDNTDAEAYWSLVLCRYGIEYVEDPATHKRVPTINRTQYTSIFADENYKSALQYANVVQKEVYEAEAKLIDGIQKGILAISEKEEPFDVFICYKETDDVGRRTPDSVLANDLYHQLIQEGFKVFFSRITLEDKLGQEYEPYIFAALNSAKVMVVLGTKPEYYNAVWVKNEWSRYLGLIRNGAKKILVPAYKDMDPYDLPEEFSHLQAQDMSKLGFMQDLIRGIKKLVGNEEEKTQPKIVENKSDSNNREVESLLKRIKVFLEDDEFERAEEYCEKVLDIDVENAQVYIYKLMIERGVNEEQELKEEDASFEKSSNYIKAYKYADTELKLRLKEYLDASIHNEMMGIYRDAKNTIRTGEKDCDFDKAKNYIKKLSKYQNSKELVFECEKLLEERKSQILEDEYNKNIERFNNARTAEHASEVALKFLKLGDYKDSQVYVEKAEKLSKEIKYNEYKAKMERNNSREEYFTLAKQFEALDGYEDSNELAKLCKERAQQSIYNSAIVKMDSDIESDWEEAIRIFKSLSGWRDSNKKIEECERKKIARIEEIRMAKEREKQKLEQLKTKHKRQMIMLIVAIAIVITSVVVGVRYYERLQNSKVTKELMSASWRSNSDEDVTIVFNNDGTCKYTFIHWRTEELTSVKYAWEVSSDGKHVIISEYGQSDDGTGVPGDYDVKYNDDGIYIHQYGHYFIKDE